MAADTCGKQVLGKQSRREPTFDSENWKQIGSEDVDYEYECIRPEYGDDGYCRWHTAEDVPADDLVGQLEVGERIDGAQFGEYDFDGVEFIFEECGLADSNFNGTRLDDVDFVGSPTRNTVLRGSTFRIEQLDGTNFEHVQLNNATIEAAQPEESTLLNVSFDQSTLTDTEFKQLQLVDCEFPDATLDGTTFEQTNQEASTFSDATLSNVTVTDGRVSGVDFSSVEEFRQIQFLSTTIEACSFKDVIDRHGQTSFANSTVICSSFNEGDFPQLDCTNATVINTSLRNTELNGADFEGSTLVWTLFGGRAPLTTVNFTDVTLLGMSVIMPDKAELELENIERAVPADTKPQVVPRSTELGLWVDDLEDYLTEDITPATPVDSFVEDVDPETATRGSAGGVSKEDLPLRYNEWDGSLKKQPSIRLTPTDESARVSNLVLKNADLSYSQFADLTFDEPVINEVSLLKADVNGIEFQAGEFLTTDLSGLVAKDIAIPKTTFDKVTVDNDTELFNRRRRRIWNRNPLAKDYLRPEIQAMKEDGSANRIFGFHGIWEQKICGSEEIDCELAATKYQEASRQYKKLEILFAANNDSRSASNCFYRSQDTKRKRHRINGKLSQTSLRWLQRAVYGYGVRPTVVIRSIIVVWLAFGLIFLYTPLTQGHNEISFGLSQLAGHELVAERLYYSATTLTSVGLGDLTPSSFYGQMLTGLEGFIGMTLVVLLGYVLGNRESW